MFFELPWVGGAQEDAMAVAIYIKYALSLIAHITFYSHLLKIWDKTKVSFAYA